MELRNFLLAAMSPGDAAALGSPMREVTLTRGQILYQPGQPVELIYFPSSACISVVRVMPDGEAAETGTIGRESAAGLVDALAGTAVCSRVFVQVAGSAITVPAAAYRARLVLSPALLRLSLKHLRAVICQAEMGAACNVVHSANARLARWLLMTEDRTGSPSFTLTQDYMAVMTGVQRTTVSAMAAALKKAGVIDYSRGQVVILDQQALKAHACECYAQMEGQFEALRARGLAHA
jgi:CRP-like cAMP-binding protein